MKLRIAENIRTFRKERKMTQEQLAEALNVTVGAVSKWESGLSMPEITLIVSLASMFETSVDVLLGYEWHSENMKQTIERIRALRNAKHFEEACCEAEKAIQKYPNSFDIVFQTGILYSLRGIEQNHKPSLNRSLDCFNHALELISQNTDPQINEWMIRNRIASVNLLLKRTDIALEQFKANNAEGLNNGDIGGLLANNSKPDEALIYLSKALLDDIQHIFRIMVAYATAYADKKDYESAEAALIWTYHLLEAWKIPGKVAYPDREMVQLLVGVAQIAALKGNLTAAEDYLRKARDHALAFDKNPSFTFDNTLFRHINEESATAFDDFGKTAIEGIETNVRSDPESREKLEAIWERIKKEE